MAISRVGGALISSINGAEQEAIKCKVFWDANRGACLKMAPWKCAKKRASLSRLSAVPISDWDYTYQLPSDYIRLISVEDSTSYEVDYEEEGNTLLSDSTSVIISYVHRLQDTGQYHPLLIEIMATRLAYLICVPLSGSKSLRDSLYMECGQLLLRGEAENAFEYLDVKVRKTDSWSAARQS
jgi:hypothetical protein